MRRTMPSTPTLMFNHLLPSVLFLVFFTSSYILDGDAASGLEQVHVGVILDKSSWIGNMSYASILVAVDDFYSQYPYYRTRLSVHLRDIGRFDAIGAADAAIDLLKNRQAQAIIGPQTSPQAKFVVALGNRTDVPVLSFSPEIPSISTQKPYLIQMQWDYGSQATAIAAIVEKFNWRDVVVVFEDSDYGYGFVPHLSDALKRVDARIACRCRVPLNANDGQMASTVTDLLKANPSRVFVVHMSYSLAIRVFQTASREWKENDWVWITTNGVTDMIDQMGSEAIRAMQGVLGVQPFVRADKKLQEFKVRWKNKYCAGLSGCQSLAIEPTFAALLAYDAVWSLALAAESNVSEGSKNNSSVEFGIPTRSVTGEALQSRLSEEVFDGISGEYRVIEGQQKSGIFEIVNVGRHGRKQRVGFWTSKFGITGRVDSKADLEPILWPGNMINSTPTGWRWPTDGVLKIGVPSKPGFSGFLKKEENGSFSGYCVQVFKEVMAALPYQLNYTFEQYGEDSSNHSMATYDDLIYQVYNKRYDAVVGDVTITADRSLYVDFTFPYTESGVRMVVPVRDVRHKSPWAFLKPLTDELWGAAAGFFVFTGFVIWFIEHRLNKNFRGSRSEQIGGGLYFIFSTLVFAHKPIIYSNLSKIVLIVWVFVVLILQQSYTASLSSILTVQQLQPTVTDLDQVVKSGGKIGYMKDSFMPQLLKRLSVPEDKIIPYASPDDYNEALSTGEVAAVVDELPYLRVFQRRFCSNYTIVGQTYKRDGFGFAFPIGSPFLRVINQALLNFTESTRMIELERELYGDKVCPDKDDSVTSTRLTFSSFSRLFLITGVSCVLALIIHVAFFFFNHGCGNHDMPNNLRGWLAILARPFLYEAAAGTPEGNDRTTELQVEGDHVAISLPVFVSTTGSTPGTSNHMHGELCSDSDSEAPPEEGTPGRDLTAGASVSPSFSEMIDARNHGSIPLPP